MNPKLKRFFEDYPELTLLGLAWACYWRLTLVFLAVYIGLLFIFMLFALIAGV